jgi:hypothetical protein
MIFLRYFGCTILSAIFCVLVAHAQIAPVPSNSNSAAPAAQTLSQPVKTKQSINFEDELVEGTAQKPEFFYLFQKKNFNYKRLIRLRENFIPEMRRTSEEIQRLRGGR